MPTARKPIPLHPLLFGAYAVLFLYASNLSETSADQVIPPLLAVVAVVGVLLLLGTLVLRDAARAAVLLSAFVIFFFGYRHVTIIAADSPISGRPLQVLWLLIGVGAVLLALRGGRELRIATRALNAISGALVIIALITIVPYEVNEFQQTGGETAAVEPLPSVEPSGKPLRDIWVLVFDRYGSAESLKLGYGIDETFTPWLKEHGFHVSPNAHANYQRTSLSLASSLNLDYLQNLPAATRSSWLNDHAVGRFLTDLGYRYIHIGSQYGPTRSGVRATVNRRLEDASDFVTALYDSSLAPSIAHRLGQGKLDPRRQRQFDWASYELNALDETLDEPGPKFVFAHLILPHPPYVFDAEGHAVPDDVSKKQSTAENYEQQKLYLNSRIKKLLEPLLAKPEAERPIIVLMADEGPYPKRYEGDPQIQGHDPDFDWKTVTDEELRIKFGILHAMLLPGIDDADVPTEMTSVNTFRFLFDEYFDAGLPLRENNVYIPISGEYTDVADRLGVKKDPGGASP